MGCCDQMKAKAGLLKRGVIGLGRVALRIGIASPSVIGDRRDLCRVCPEATRRDDWQDRPSQGLTTMSKCKLCRCIIAAKTQLKSEKCPAGKW